MRASFVVTMALTLATAACASAPARPAPHSEFEDIPVPRGLAYQPDRSTIIESPSVKAARLVYRARLTPDSLATAIRTTLEANGWRNVSSTANGTHGATQVYEKTGNSLEVLVWEGLWYTYVEMTVSRALVQAK